MPKTVAAGLLADIQANVTTLATCIQITRKDGQILRMTTHDTDLTVAGVVYKHDMPFVLAAIQSTSQLAVDNTQLTLFADEVSIFLADFKSGLFQYSEVLIFQVNYTDVTRGTITMRTGWFGQIVYSENHVIQITVTGLLKVLDLEVGRVYQPSCDADLGDSRCRVAIQQNQIRSELNPYRFGDWVYYYDPAEMTTLTVVNSSFESDGAIGAGTPITGWTKTAGAQFQVRADNGGLGSFSVLDGTYMLVGAAISSAPYESGIYQDINVSGQISNNTAIDAGKITIMFRAAILSTLTVKNTWRLRAELMDVNGVILDSQDTRYVPLDAIDSWRERAVVMPLLPGTRTVRIWLYNFSGATGGVGAADAADRVLMYWWDHSVGNPYDDVIHHVTRIGAYGADASYYMYYGSFEFGPISNADNNNLHSHIWTTGAGNWWQVVANPWSGALLSTVDGTYFLAGGDNGSGVTSLYTTTQIHPLQTAASVGGWGLDSGRTLLGKYVANLLLWVGYGDTTSKATVLVEWMSDVSTVIGSAVTVVNDVVGTVGWHAISSAPMNIPGAARFVRVTLKARSPVGTGSAKAAFDNVRFIIYDRDRPLASDPVSAFGSASTVFDVTIGNTTVDNGIIWKALSAKVAYDVVASVIDARKEFVVTAMAGANGTFETGPIRFVSGANAGLRNIMRKWDSVSGHLKLYFRAPHDIQVGDRFYYAQSCQRRFIEDCLLRYENTLNFQGFPYVPGVTQMTANPASIAPSAASIYQTLPGTGPAAGGTGITITGNAAVQYITAIFFDGVPATGFVRIDVNTVQCISPPHAAGVVLVTSNGDYGDGTWSGAAAGQFTYV